MRSLKGKIYKKFLLVNLRPNVSKKNIQGVEEKKEEAQMKMNAMPFFNQHAQRMIHPCLIIHQVT